MDQSPSANSGIDCLAWRGTKDSLTGLIGTETGPLLGGVMDQSPSLGGQL